MRSWGATGRLTQEALADQVGCRRSTLPTWWKKFRAGGGWLERAAAHVAAWLAETHGIQRSRKAIYYWLEKFGLRPTPTVSLLLESAPAKPAVPTRQAASRR